MYKVKLVIVLFVVFTSFSDRAVTRAQDFGYDGDRGPMHWGEQFNTCFGKHQSPINIDSLVVRRVNLPTLQFIGFDDTYTTNITNNGHTVMLQLSTPEPPSIAGGPLQGEYDFLQLHFHWGDNDTIGSEDLIDSQSFPMELHMVFYKKSYGSARAAMNYSDGLAVLAFFYKVADIDNTAYTELTTLLSNVTQPNTAIMLQEPAPLRKFLPDDDSLYYTYNGSLTTPPCSEIVTWIDFKEPIILSHEQIEAFRALQSEHGQLTHNFRPIQPLGDRVVLFNINTALDTNEVEPPPQDISGEAQTEQPTTTTTKEPKTRFRKHKKSSAFLQQANFYVTLLALISSAKML